MIITGKNGSGKTIFLKEINKKFLELLNKKDQTENGTYIRFSTEDYLQKINKENFILTFFETKRLNSKYEIHDMIPNINNTTLLNYIDNSTNPNLYEKFVSYLVRLRVSYLNAKYSKELGGGDREKEAKEIMKWFENLEKLFQTIFEKNGLMLEYDDTNLDYKIVYENKTIGFNELSDGYSSWVAILAELILRMESACFGNYNSEGVVLIDNIDSILHISSQKKVLPILCELFRNIQFIVSTHSPFVISSIENAILFNLDAKSREEDLSRYTYDELVEKYF